MAIRGARRRPGWHALPWTVRGTAVARVPPVRDANLDAAIPLAGLLLTLLLADERRRKNRDEGEGRGADWYPSIDY